MFGRVRKFYDIGSIMGAAGAAAGGPVGLAVSAGLQGITALVQGIRAGKMNRQADELERNTVRPDYRIQQGVIDNQRYAESRMGQGLSDAALVAYSDQANRGMNTFIDAILRGGGDVNNIAAPYETAENDYMKVAMLEEEARLRNAQIYMDTNERTSAEQDKAWQLNVYNPYMDRVQAIDRLRNRANATGDGARNMALGAVNNYVTGNLLRGQIGFGNGAPAAASYGPVSPALPAGAIMPTSSLPPLATPGINPNAQGSGMTSYSSYFLNMIRPTNVPVPYRQ